MPDNPEEKKPDFPKEFSQCPSCGSTDRVANHVLQQLKDAKKAGPNMIAFIYKTQSLIMDQTKNQLSAPLVKAFYDICVECGTYYCIHVEVKVAIPQLGKEQTQGGIMN